MKEKQTLLQFGKFAISRVKGDFIFAKVCDNYRIQRSCLVHFSLRVFHWIFRKLHSAALLKYFGAISAATEFVAKLIWDEKVSAGLSDWKLVRWWKLCSNSVLSHICFVPRVWTKTSQTLSSMQFILFKMTGGLQQQIATECQFLVVSNINRVLSARLFPPF